MKKELGVVILPSYYESMKDLKNKDRLAIYDAIMKFGFYHEEVELSGEPRRLFNLMRPNIESSQRRYAASQENGAKGGAPKGNQNARKHKHEDNQTDNQENNQTFNHDKDMDKDIDTELASNHSPREQEMTYSVTPNDVVEYPIGSGIYKLKSEAPNE